MKVFISYGSADDQVTALRLQALAAVNGLTVYVPPAFTRQTSQLLLDATSARELNEANVILGVVAAGLTDACRQELNTGLALQKTMIVMSGLSFAPQLQPVFGSNLVVINPSNPSLTEQSIMQHLTKVNVEQNARVALLALGTLALGLLIFAPSD